MWIDSELIMTIFQEWFSKVYQDWCRNLSGKEDFLAFCDFLGYPPYKVLEWLQGEEIPRGAEVLNLAANFGCEVYRTLNLEPPNPEILKIFTKFPHLDGDERSRLSIALYEIQQRAQEEGLSFTSPEGKSLVKSILTRAGW